MTRSKAPTFALGSAGVGERYTLAATGDGVDGSPASLGSGHHWL